MRIHSLAALALTLTCATLASAQANAPRQTQEGFFRPSADPSLTAPHPAGTRPTEALVAEDKVQAAQENVAADRAPSAAKVMQWTQEEMDRSRQEAERAKPAPNAPAPINGAFTGSTNERDR